MKLGLIVLFLMSCASMESSESLMGQDKDKDGVRDDVQKWIETKSSVDNENYRMALKQYAKYMRMSFLFIKDKERSVKNTFKVAYAHNCVTLINRELMVEITKESQKYTKEKRIFMKNVERELNKVREDNEKLEEVRTYWIKKAKEKSHNWRRSSRNYWNAAGRSTNDMDTVSSMMYNSWSRQKAHSKIDLNFSGKTVWRSKKIKDVCEFQLK